MKRLLPLLVLLALVSSQPRAQPLLATAFVDRWTVQTGVYVTRGAQRALWQLVADEFGRTAPAVGFAADEVQKISLQIQTAGDLRFGAGATGPFVLTPQGPIPLRSETQWSLLQRLIGFQNVSLYLERFSTIQLDVRPVPPRDYSVIINGEECPATERGLYKVQPGTSAVNVARGTAPACQWTGQIAPGQVQLVACNF